MFDELSDWIWTALFALVGVVYKSHKDRLHEIEENLRTYQHDQSQLMTVFVTKDYIEKDVKPILHSMETEIGTLLTQTADLEKRAEYKMDLTAVHERINSLEKRKRDKEV